jgi:hypothetical protein
VGDADGALRAWEHYLGFRWDPEPSLAEEVARIRAQVEGIRARVEAVGNQVEGAGDRVERVRDPANGGGDAKGRRARYPRP